MSVAIRPSLCCRWWNWQAGRPCPMTRSASALAPPPRLWQTTLQCWCCGTATACRHCAGMFTSQRAQAWSMLPAQAAPSAFARRSWHCLRVPFAPAINSMPQSLKGNAAEVCQATWSGDLQDVPLTEQISVHASTPLGQDHDRIACSRLPAYRAVRLATPWPPAKLRPVSCAGGCQGRGGLCWWAMEALHWSWLTPSGVSRWV